MKMWRKRLELHEIKPLDQAKDQIRKVTYSKVSNKILTKRKLRHIWKLANAKKRPDILEDDEFLYFQYPKKPIIIIRKESGKLYSVRKPDKWIRHQAYIILAILDSFGFVNNYKRETVCTQGKNLWRKKK